MLQGKNLNMLLIVFPQDGFHLRGNMSKDLSDNFSNYTGADYALSVSNGTVALHLALVALGIRPGDEVIVPDLTFASPLNAVLYVGAKL